MHGKERVRISHSLIALETKKKKSRPGLYFLLNRNDQAAVRKNEAVI